MSNMKPEEHKDDASDEYKHQQLQQQYYEQQQQQMQQYQFQQMAQSMHNDTAISYETSVPINSTSNSSAFTNNAAMVAAAVQAAAANSQQNADTNNMSNNYGYPRNSAEFACAHVGERVKGKRRKYCPHEVTALILGVQRYADDSCPWSNILRDQHLGRLFHERSGVDLKDKWRTLIKSKPELAIYTENRKNHRKYRPFSTVEERALLDGVRKYQGQRNVWSLILVDEELGPKFNDRSNVQLKDKFRTMKRAGSVDALALSSSSSNARVPVSTPPRAETKPSPSSDMQPVSRPIQSNRMSNSGSMYLPPQSSPVFNDPSMYLGSFSGMQPQSYPSHQAHQAQQAQAMAQARAQALMQQQIQQEASKPQQMYATAGQIPPGYHLMGNQLVPTHAMYYNRPMAPQQMHHLQQQWQMQQAMAGTPPPLDMELKQDPGRRQRSEGSGRNTNSNDSAGGTEH